MKKKSSKKKGFDTHKKIVRYSIKFILIIIVFSLILTQTNKDEFYNTLPLLAVNENDNGDIVGGSIIDLNLRVTPGNGEIFVNANSLKEIDTQLSITNGHETACQLFNLNCDNYNFYYTFKGDSVILKGPSATSSIALITAKTLNKETISDNIAMTGSLNSVGIIGPVGGISQKISLAKREGYEKIIVPFLSSQNSTNNASIEVIRALDITQVYNAYGGEPFSIEKKELNSSSYESLMSSLSKRMCSITSDLENQIHTKNLSNESQRLYTQAQEQINSSEEAVKRNSYYSSASFCFGANNNLETLKQYQKNETKKELLKKIDILSQEISSEKEQFNSNEYIQSMVRTKNDFYVYLILQDRIHEAEEFLEPHSSNVTNTSIDELKQSYAFSKQRFKSIDLWESFMVHNGENVKFNNDIIENACRSITRDINSKGRVLEQYGAGLFDDLIEEQNELTNENQYRCIYNGLELTGRINTAFFSFNMERQSNMTNKLFDITQTRIAQNPSKDFPIMPYIYFQYSKELYQQGDVRSSLLYINFAQSFSNIDFYLQEETNTISQAVEEAKNEFITHPLLLVALLILIGFI